MLFTHGTKMQIVLLVKLIITRLVEKTTYDVKAGMQKQPQNRRLLSSYGHMNVHLNIYVNTLNTLIRGAQVERMTMLREKGCDNMQQRFPLFYYSGYKTYTLKYKIIKHFRYKIKLWAPNHRSELDYCDKLDRGPAMYDSKKKEKKLFSLQRVYALCHRLSDAPDALQPARDDSKVSCGA